MRWAWEPLSWRGGNRREEKTESKDTERGAEHRGVQRQVEPLSTHCIPTVGMPRADNLWAVLYQQEQLSAQAQGWAPNLRRKLGFLFPRSPTRKCLIGRKISSSPSHTA